MRMITDSYLLTLTKKLIFGWTNTKNTENSLPGMPDPTNDVEKVKNCPKTRYNFKMQINIICIWFYFLITFWVLTSLIDELINKLRTSHE